MIFDFFRMSNEKVFWVWGVDKNPLRERIKNISMMEEREFE